jgi:hypothetical protein
MVAEILGVFGFFLACASLGWHVWTYRQGRKEKIEAKASIQGTMRVDVRNAGHRPVYVSQVAIRWARPVPREFGEPGSVTLALRGMDITLGSEDDPKEPLQPGQGRVYRLSKDVIRACRPFAGLPRKRVWLSICSPAGEIKKLSDDSTYAVIMAMAEAAERSNSEPIAPIG